MEEIIKFRAKKLHEKLQEEYKQWYDDMLKSNKINIFTHAYQICFMAEMEYLLEGYDAEDWVSMFPRLFQDEGVYIHMMLYYDVLDTLYETYINMDEVVLSQEFIQDFINVDFTNDIKWDMKNKVIDKA